MTYVDDNFWKWTISFNDTTDDNFSTSVTIWHSCPFCGEYLEWTNYKYCYHCGEMLIPDEPEPSNKDVIAKLDEMIKELNEFKAKLIKE